MTEIISVRFKPGGKQYYFDPQGQTVQAGQGVILETARGLEYGECTHGNHMVEDTAVVQPLRTVVRVATEKDIETVKQNREKEEKSFKVCQEKIAEHGLDMKLVDVEYSFESIRMEHPTSPTASPLWTPRAVQKTFHIWQEPEPMWFLPLMMTFPMVYMIRGYANTAMC